MSDRKKPKDEGEDMTENEWVSERGMKYGAEWQKREILLHKAVQLTLFVL